MASGDYTRGEMDVEAQESMYGAFLKAGAWGAIITLLILAYSTFTLSMGMNWLIALALSAGGGIAVGLFMGFGGAWVATVIALSGLALFVQLLITLGQMVF